MSIIADEYFKKYKELAKRKFGEEKYNSMTEQQHFMEATVLITLMGAVEKHINKENI